MKINEGKGDVDMMGEIKTSRTDQPINENYDMHYAALNASTNTKNPIKLTFKNLEYEVNINQKVNGVE